MHQRVVLSCGRQMSLRSLDQVNLLLHVMHLIRLHLENTDNRLRGNGGFLLPVPFPMRRVSRSSHLRKSSVTSGTQGFALVESVILNVLVPISISPVLFSRVAIQSTERKRVLVQTCRQSHLSSVRLSVGRSICPEGVLWQNS